MLRSRLIPCLLVEGKGLVKTVRFKEPKYVGDPINAVKIFNEKEVDELLVLDISASREGRAPDYALIEKLAMECRMPLCYGGGVKSVEQAERIHRLGVEKVAISSAALDNPSLIHGMAAQVGRQSVVVVLDVAKKGLRRTYEVLTHNGTKSTGVSPFDFAKRAEELGAGEIVVNSIDRDGTMTGYDLELVEKMRSTVQVPMSVLGGAGSLEDVGKLLALTGTVGAGAGSLFVFKGKYRAVLITYPSRAERLALTGR